MELNRLGDLVSAVGSADFELVFYTLLRDIFEIEECTVFSFRPSARPDRLVIQSESAAARDTALQLADEWVGGDYRYDPHVRRYQLTSSRCALVVKPEQLDNVGYRQRYYDSPSINQELGLLGEIDETKYLITLVRKSCRADFREADIITFEMMSGFVLKTIHRHNILAKQASENLAYRAGLDLSSPEGREKVLMQLKELLLSGTNRLSRREAEVCSRIALGYSTLAISLHFGISLNTVATHRKRAYAKLQISSQNELFSRYLHLFGSNNVLAA